MKVAIVTITNGENYGNRLQNYALQKIIENLGIEVETLNNVTGENKIKKYIQKYILRSKLLKVYEKYDMNFSRKLNQYSRRSKFKNFNEKYIKRSQYKISKEYIPQKIAEEYEYFVCGSDQIWNPYFSFNSDIEFLSFAKKKQRIAYAASFGVSSIPEELRGRYAQLINGIENISVREYAGAKIIEELTGRVVDVLIDPTLVVERKEWLKLVDNKPKRNAFILTYFMGEMDAEIKKRIERLSKERNLKIVNLLDNKDRAIYSLDPIDFIDLIHQCEVFFTDSFHGVVFSIIMESSFVVCERSDSNISMNSRLETLLSLFSMQNRKFKSIMTNNQLLNTEFKGTNEILTIKRKEAINYLKSSLKIGKEDYYEI